ncbi:imidazolonepropionase-like amidohydrolase [Mucilaginibacter frigoritolerans]|uniref:Imidazolonepropionase-like amidohydrolase n=1 Tax=Mucilaginibacter frigoritolerans TaxID=652788 RepID=A0A562U9L5_9SPHI|nr:amidohydrolase family protein [Mucilaginibacter frigoritolerans]TWJ02520.1 imidazolonepropionase-like amidohydrolase [Mucilaginibacter frigoritolerans]
MKRLLLLLSSAGLVLNAGAQNLTADSGVFLLHKFEKNIGKETYHLTKSKDKITYSVDFKFTDRGSPVPLKTELSLTPALQPLSLFLNGRVARSATINDSITIKGNSASIKVDDSTFTKNIDALTFPIAGYAPGTAQQVLLQFWKKHHNPTSIKILPVGAVQIKKDGEDELSFNGKPLLLDRYTISGLIWGNELVWTDKAGNLICLITNDAEADKLEMMSEQYESLLPELIARAAGYSMRLFTSAVPTQTAGDKVIAIVGGTLVDVVNQKTIPDAVVLEENGVITQVGKVGGVTIPKGAKIIDTKGKTILPGLWDMHAHFEQAEWGPAYLAAGVTTVRDCGNEFEYINAVKKAIDDGKGIGPLILKAGIIDGKGPYGLGVIQADTKEEAIKAVDRYKENGFVQIKIYSSVKPAIVKAICDEAHRLNLTVTGHIPEGMTLQQGVDSGMNMVNHITYVYSIMKRNKDRSIDFNDSISVAAIKFIKDHHVVIDPTVGVFEMEFRSTKDDITTMEPAFYTLPLPLQALFKDTGMDPTRAAKFRLMYQSLLKILKVLYDNDVTIVAGTDQGFPGYSLDRELELYVDAGLTPMQAIQTATITPARVMKVDKQSGSIETGKQADLIIVDGDPLNNIRAIRNVTLVIKAGHVYEPVKLHQLVGFTK